MESRRPLSNMATDSSTDTSDCADLTRGSPPSLRDSPAVPRQGYPVALLIALISIAALVPSIVLALLALNRWDRAEAERESELAQGLSRAYSQSIDRHLQALVNTATVLAGSRHLQADDLVVFDQHARDAAVNAGGHFVLVGRDFQQLVNTRTEPGAPLPKTANPGNVSQVLQSAVPMVTDLLPGAVAATDVFAILVPVIVRQETRFVLAFVPDPRTILQLLSDRYRPDGWLAAVIDSRGRIIARTQKQDEFFGKSATILDRLDQQSGAFESVDLEGNASLTGYSKLSNAKWTVVAWSSKELLGEPRRRMLRLLSAMIAAALAVSILASWVVSILVRDPAFRLVELAAKVGKISPLEFNPTVMREANVVGDSLVTAAQEIEHRTRALHEVGQRLQLAIDAAGAGFWSIDLKTGEYQLDRRSREIAGLQSSDGSDVASIIAAIHPDDRPLVTDALRRAREFGQEGRFDVEFRLVGSDGAERWASTQARQLVTANGGAQLVGIIRDVTRRKRDEQKINLLMREVIHRSKNLLAVVQSIAGQTARSGDPATFLRRFQQRLAALAASQTLLVQSEWKGVQVRALVEAQLAHYKDLFGGRIAFNGPELELKPDAAQAIGLALHELATNAAKHGALSNAAGSVRITWSSEIIDANRYFHLIWTERGGPHSENPRGTGFGSIVTGRMVEAAVSGQVASEFGESGFEWHLRAPFAGVVDGIS